MGLLGQLEHPEVVRAIDTITRKVRATDLLLGVATGYSHENVLWWKARGVQWICLNIDYANLYLHSKMILDNTRSLWAESEKA
jgi:2-keto-3-deoxy-L-rhamnonate aldolase RhmA